MYVWRTPMWEASIAVKSEYQAVVRQKFVGAIFSKSPCGKFLFFYCIFWLLCIVWKVLKLPLSFRMKQTGEVVQRVEHTRLKLVDRIPGLVKRKFEKRCLRPAQPRGRRWWWVQGKVDARCYHRLAANGAFVAKAPALSLAQASGDERRRSLVILRRESKSDEIEPEKRFRFANVFIKYI